MTNLGQIQRMYIEANGSFTLVKANVPKPGLCVLPEWDTEFNNEQQRDNNTEVCGFCGFEKQPSIHECPNCKRKNRVSAVHE